MYVPLAGSGRRLTSRLKFVQRPGWTGLLWGLTPRPGDPTRPGEKDQTHPRDGDSRPVERDWTRDEETETGTNERGLPESQTL